MSSSSSCSSWAREFSIPLNDGTVRGLVVEGGVLALVVVVVTSCCELLLLLLVLVFQALLMLLSAVELSSRLLFILADVPTLLLRVGITGLLPWVDVEGSWLLVLAAAKTYFYNHVLL